MCSPNGDQSGQWRSISMTSQWPLIMTSQWVMTLHGTMFLCRAISVVLRTREVSLHKHNSYVLPRLFKHEFVLVIFPHDHKTTRHVFIIWSHCT